MAVTNRQVKLSADKTKVFSEWYACSECQCECKRLDEFCRNCGVKLR